MIGSFPCIFNVKFLLLMFVITYIVFHSNNINIGILIDGNIAKLSGMVHRDQTLSRKRATPCI